ncbi:MAG: S8 family serine peptidase, partial [Candidatus Marinimicrobia bacterium]|nr:S8 family serine peptidase [Candidatus Neomarinimicrobiota bacterium]
MFWALPSFAGNALWLYLEDKVSVEAVKMKLDEHINLRYYSPALHALSVSLGDDFDEDEELEKLAEMPGVKLLQPVGKLKTPKPTYLELQIKKTSASDYGPAYHQLDMLGITKLNELGYWGEGVRIGLLDQGFKTNLNAFKHILDDNRLVAEYDFVYGDRNTSDEADEGTYGIAQKHGTGTWSIIGAYEEGKYSGGAPKAEFALAKTEDMRWELPMEEDNYVAGIEFMVANNMDIVSVSLAYMDFDGTEFDYTFEDLDGQTTAAAKICNWAAKQGLIIVQSAGNEGLDGASSIWTPADAPSVITVGSVNSYGIISDFSSRGPTADGRIKPDVVALGEYVYMIGTDNNVRAGNGTSFATPLVACGIALLKEMHPEWTVEELFAKFEEFSEQGIKDNAYGWGMPDFYKIAIESPVSPVINFKIFPNPTDYLLNLKWISGGDCRKRVSIYDLLGREISNYSMYSLIEGFQTVIRV